MKDAIALNRIAQWINTVYTLEQTIAGVIYIHDITHYPIGGLEQHNFSILEQIVGEKNFENITLVTSGGLLDTAIEETRVQALEEDSAFWQRMRDGHRRAEMKRFLGTHESAKDIV